MPTETPAPDAEDAEAVPVSGLEIALVDPGTVATEPEPESEAVAEPSAAAQPDAQPEPIAQPEPVVEPQPEAQAEPEAVAETVATDEEVEVAQPVVRPAQDTSSDYAGGWVCSEEILIEDSRVRGWSVGRVSFRVRDGFERAVLHLDRAGIGSGDPASITADSMGSWKIKENIAGADRPGLGRRSIVLRLGDGFSGSLALRGYRPAGLDIIKEYSVYPAGRDGRNVVISADTDGCYRVRVPAWDDSSNTVRRAEIHVDIKP
jgi:hypothetical protein